MICGGFLLRFLLPPFPAVATKELQTIVDAHLRARRKSRAAALVTVVRTSGSTYRRPGARMLVLAEAGGGTRSVGADFLGSISGGCLEDDARDHAREVMADGRARLVRYDTTAEGDVLYGSGLGCQGVVEVLIEPLPADAGMDPDHPADPVGCIAWSLRHRRSSALASVVGVEPPGTGAEAVRAGDFLWLVEDGEPVTTLADPALAGLLTADTRTALRQGRGGSREHPLPSGQRVQAFVDLIVPPRSLLICGAGYDAVPLARLGKELGWRVRVVDGRKAYTVPERFPGVDELVHCPPPQFAARIPIEPGEAAMVMTHNFLHDRDVLRALLGSAAGYIGVLGPRKRTDRLLEELAADGGKGQPMLGTQSLRRLHGPAGLDIGAEAPEQIALAIIAEIEAVSARRPGGVLKRRKAPLHGG